MKRTPYSVGPYGDGNFPGAIGPSRELEQSGYIFVLEDVRGAYMSGGEFADMRPFRPGKSGSETDESSDTYDTIQWLVDHLDNDNGKVGMWGISYPGFYSAIGMIDAHPALVAVSPQAPIADWFFDDFHHCGAFFLPHAFGFLVRFGQPRPAPTTERNFPFSFGTPDGYRFYLDLGSLVHADRYMQHRVRTWDDIVEHPDYDEFWQARNLLPHLSHVAPAVLVVGGWFDAEDLYGALQIYRAVERLNPTIENSLVMGPWVHGGWARGDGDHIGNVAFPGKPSAHYRAEIEARFFEHWLKGTDDPLPPEASVYDTGADEWRAYDTWPPKEARESELYLAAGGTLARSAPGGDGFDEFESDPAHPVPFTEAVATGMTREYMTDDQRFASRRPDVLAYQTEPLAEPLTLAGPLEAELVVSTSREDADWVVKLIDVFPPDAPDHPGMAENEHMGGYEMMVRSEVLRGRFRASYSEPKPFRPDEPTPVTVKLQDVLHTFGKGHRLMVQIQSTWFPLVDRNPQKWVDNIFKADDADFVKATHRVYRAGKSASRVKFLVLGP